MKKEKLIAIKFFTVQLQKPFRFNNCWWKKVHFNKGVAFNDPTKFAIINLTGIVAIPKSDLRAVDIGEVVNEF